MRCLALALVALFSFALPAAAEETVFSGVVTTRVDGLPLPGATVSIDALSASTVTDANGRYTLSVLADPAKTVGVRVAASGLTPRTTQVKLAPGPVTVDFGLSLGFAEELVVGSRAPGAASEKAVPVDIITSQQIQATGYTETAQVIQALAPSFNFTRTSVTDGSDTVRPATLRGLGPDQLLVLVNGKRRHTSALVHLNGSVGRGSTGVDLNAIPVSAIEKIEILRDGAAAQYGSDAIAGVINIVLKTTVHPLTLSLNGGLNKGSFPGNRCNTAGTVCAIGNDIDYSDGELWDAAGSIGWTMGKAVGTVAAEYRHRDRSNRASPDPRDQIRAGDAGNNPVPQPNHRWGDPDTRDFLSFANLTLPLGTGETTFAYAFGGYSHRSANSAGFYRRSLDVRNWPQIYPLGFLPEIQPEVEDASGTLGVRGARGGWFFDASAQYGHNSFAFTIGNTLNVSLGPTIPPNKTVFDAGRFAFDQFILNADMSRPVDVGFAGPLNVAFGAEYRREKYRIDAGEPDSYRNGGVRNQAGGLAALGSQVFPGFQPTDVVDEGRTSFALYVDLEGDVASKLRLGVAGRFENYSDFGSTLDGKLSLRLEASPKFVIRGAASTGFRAPSLGQSFFSSTATNFINVPGLGLQPFETKTAPVSSPLARALGAQDLEPEESVHFSGGFVVSPVPELQLTADYYFIGIDKRIVISGNFNQAQLQPILRPLGASAARFFTNAIDTSTSGVDVTGAYAWKLSSSGTLRLSASYNYSKTDIDQIRPTPPQLVGLEATLFDRGEQRRIECIQPRDGIRLGAGWMSGRFGADARVNRYGEFCSTTIPPADDQQFGAKWLADFEVNWRQPHYSLAFGVQNAFNAFPDRFSAVNSNSGIFTYPSYSPTGMNGRFVYGKVTFRF